MEKTEHLPVILTKKNEQTLKNDISNKKEIKGVKVSETRKVYLTKFKKLNEEKFFSFEFIYLKQLSFCLEIKS